MRARYAATAATKETSVGGPVYAVAAQETRIGFKFMKLERFPQARLRGLGASNAMGSANPFQAGRRLDYSR
jgi:hypothetical protein